MSKSKPNFIRLDPGLPEVAVLVTAMLQARDAAEQRSWSLPHESTTEYWWADVLADPRARSRRHPGGFYGSRGQPQAQPAHYTLADERHPTISVACRKCPWSAEFSRADLVAIPWGRSPPADLTRSPCGARLSAGRQPGGTVRSSTISIRSIELPAERSFEIIRQTAAPGSGPLLHLLASAMRPTGGRSTAATFCFRRLR